MATQAKELSGLRSEAAHCKACDLYKHATQTVFGDGSPTARIMLVGEQPGDREDIVGKPFVGPAGRMLYSALDRCKVSPADVYITNAVKHFNFIERGKKRIHAKPKVIHINACAPWLDAELDVVTPELIVALGATALRALLGPGLTVGEARGKIMTSDEGRRVLVTVHPSAIIRNPDKAERHAEFEHFVRDLSNGFKQLAL